MLTLVENNIKGILNVSTAKLFVGITILAVLANNISILVKNILKVLCKQKMSKYLPTPSSNQSRFYLNIPP